jgi:phage-related protein
MATALSHPEKITTDSTKKTGFSTIRTQFGDGYAQIAPKGINNKIQSLSIQWASLTQAEFNAIITMLDTVGSYGVISYTPCYETSSKNFRMTDSGYTFSSVGNTYKITCDLVQVYDI